MKDENGALKIGASQQVPNEDILNMSNLDYERQAKDIIAEHLGNEIVKNFEIFSEEPAWLNGTVYHTEVVVMTVKDYKKLAEYAWMYKDLQK